MKKTNGKEKIKNETKKKDVGINTSVEKKNNYCQTILRSKELDFVPYEMISYNIEIERLNNF
jgi:hypothetical protein